MTTKTMPALAGDWLKHESDPRHAREAVVLASTGSEAWLASGTVLGRVLTQSPAVAAPAMGNTGDGGLGSVTVGAGAAVGVHRLTVFLAVANAGLFTLAGPDGVLLGIGQVGAAVQIAGLAFTLADGATDFAAGDGFTITVAPGSGKARALQPAGTDGSEVPWGVLIDPVSVPAAGDARGLALVRGPALVRAEGLLWPDTYDSAARAAGREVLARHGIVARPGA